MKGIQYIVKMLKQRTVSETLGRNNTHHHEEIYKEIEKKIGPTLICNFGNTRGSKTGVKHEGSNPIPIRDFELHGVSISPENNIQIKGSGLQGFCKTCSKRRRRARIDMARQENTGGYETYKQKYGKDTHKCSICKIEKSVEDNFKLSPGMECGLHNICNDCSKTYGESVGDRWIIYRPDGNFKYKKLENGQHDDHIFPLACGGSNEEFNHQLLSAKDNLEKSSTIQFNTVHEINPLLLSERWRQILLDGQRENIDIHMLESRLRNAILREQTELYGKTDEELLEYFEQYNRRWNGRKSSERAIQKFRKYCKDIKKL